MDDGLHVEDLPNLSGQIKVIDVIPFADGGFGDIRRGLWNRRSNDGSANVCIKTYRLGMNNPQGYTQRENSQRRESRVWGSLNHPNVLPLLGSFFDEQHILRGGLVSPYRQEGNVLMYLSKNIGADNKPIIVGTAKGLGYLHSKNIVHGDLKPKNIVIKIENGQIIPEIMDFGISRMLLRKGDTTKVMGNVRYTAPEILFDEEQADTRSLSKPGDVYSFAMTILEIITGHIPFSETKSEAKVIVMLERGDRPDYRRYPATNPLVRCLPLIKACWENDPAKRCSMSDAISYFQSIQ